MVNFACIRHLFIRFLCVKTLCSFLVFATYALSIYTIILIVYMSTLHSAVTNNEAWQL